MKRSLGISNFLEEISSLSHSIVFFYFFALITEEGFISPCYSLELCIQWVYISFSPLPLASLLFSAICKASSDNHFAFLHFFLLGMVLITASCTMLHSSSGTLSNLILWTCLSFTLSNHKGFDLGIEWWSRRMCAHLLQTPKSQLTTEQPSTGKHWIPSKKDAPAPRAKEKPQQDGRRGEIMFRIKSQTHQTLRGFKQNLVCTRTP